MMPVSLPWEQPQWFEQATSWIETSLARMGITLTEPPEPVRQWALGVVLRVRTTSGTMYFKATVTLLLFANEGMLLRYLAERSPRLVPDVSALDPRARWILMRDAGSAIPQPASPEEKIEILRTMVDIQEQVAPDIDTLLKAEICVDRRPETLIPLIEPLVSDPIVSERLARDEVRELESSVPTIVEMCATLSEYAVQPTLIHGDLHAGNALMHAGGMILIDWSEACIAHPFIDAFMIYNEQDHIVRERMRDAYLALWSDFESSARLRELWSCCGVVHAVHHAMSYHSILRHIPDHARNDLADTLPFLLRKALRFLSTCLDRTHVSGQCASAAGAGRPVGSGRSLSHDEVS